MSDQILLVSIAQFSDWVRENMDSMGVSQREILRRSRLSHGMITEMRRSIDMKVSTVAKIADVFGYDIALIKRQ